MQVTTLDFLRHGEPVGGKKYRGQTDDPLSEKGWAQMHAAIAGVMAAGVSPWQAIVSSPLRRCQAFADTVAVNLALPVAFDARLAEVGFGVWEGKTAAQLKQHDPNCIFDFKCDPVGKRPEGAEPLQDFYRRVADAYEAMLLRYAGQQVLVVAHAGVIRMAICHALGLPPERAYRINVASAAMARIRSETHIRSETQAEARFDNLMWLSKGSG